MKPLERNCAGTILLAPSTLKYVRDQRIGGDRLTDREGDLDGVGDQRLVSFQLHLPPRNSSEARDHGCWLGLVDAWVKTASWNCASTVWKSTSLTNSIEPCRIADIDLCVELVW